MMDTYRIRQALQHAEIVPLRLVTRDAQGVVVGRCAIGELLHDIGYSDERLTAFDKENENYPSYGASVDGLPGMVLGRLEDAYGLTYHGLVGLQEQTDGESSNLPPEQAKDRALDWVTSQEVSQSRS